MARASASDPARRALASSFSTLLIAVTALSTVAPARAAAQADSVTRSRKMVGGAVKPAEAAPDSPRAMSLVDIMNVPRIGSPRLSPDGTRLVYTRSTADWKADERVSHLWLVGADGSGARQLTRGEEG
ncbi:MAG TPA: hypothetical protein VKB18_04945, partial [Gemmatimonadota bacterium]|nr:hypothetical protein [Gemmatimonadota bacterium]